MAYWLTGLDEAGYGPLLGPLVVGLATITAESALAPREPWKRLAPTVSKRPGARGVSIADSKALHRPATGDLSPLEAGVLSFVACERGGTIPATFRELLDHLTEGRAHYLDDYPWYRDRDLDLPVSVHSLEMKACVRRLTRGLGRTGLRVEELRAVPLDVLEFNRELAKADSKHEVNARTMGRFLSWIWRQRERSEMGVFTDRLGGRERYGALLQPLFPDARFKILDQEKDQQRYHVSSESPPRNLTIQFRKEGENACFTTALASMIAKYVRELHMRLFNDWWCERSEGDLRPTAGYYADARRFLDEIETLRERLGIDRALLVRER